MLCPNCKTELVQINGRYICSDCGKEVPESEMNVGGWGQGSFGGGTVVGVPAGDETDADTRSVDIPDDYIEGQDTTPASETVAPEPQKELSIPDVEQPQPDAVNPEGVAEDVGFYDSKPDSTPADLDSLQKNTVVTSAGDPENIVSSTPEPVEEISQIPEPLPDLTVGNEALPLNAETGLLPAENAALPNDPEIYRDPSFDNQIAEEPKGQQENQKAQKYRRPIGNKNLIILVSAGVFLALALIVGGIFAYQALTKSSQVDEANLDANAEVVDCDASGSPADVTSCIAENFSACTVASWTAPYVVSPTTTATIKYQVSGQVDNTCQVEATVATSESDASLEGQAMSCLLDNTLSVTDALATIGGDTCTGGLSDILFTNTSVDQPTDDGTTGD